MKTPRPGLDRLRLVAVLTTLIAVSVVVLGLSAMVAFDRAVEPELVKRARLIGSMFRSDIQRTLDLGIPFEVVAGIDKYLDETLGRFQEVDRITVISASGAIVAEAQRPPSPSLLQSIGVFDVVDVGRSSLELPILAGNRVVGRIVVEVSPMFVETRLRGVFLDVATLALVAILIAVELAVAVTVLSVGKPLGRLLLLVREQSAGIFLHRIRPNGLSGLGRAAIRLNDQAADLAERMASLPADVRARLAANARWRIADRVPALLQVSDFNDIRLALFLFSVATEIGTAFLPIYAQAAARPDWLSPEMAAAAPLSIYLAAVAVLSPVATRLTHRFGPRRIFLASVFPGALTLAGVALSETLWAISLWRGATAVFYAMVTIACHQYALRSAGTGSSTTSSWAFLGAVYGGVFCGSALGGIIAGRFGYDTAFLAGAAIAIAAGLIGRSMMSGGVGEPGLSEPPQEVAPAGGRVVDRRFLALLLGIAAPTNAVTAIFIWYMTPLVLVAAGQGPADIARVVMLYYLAMVMTGPLTARISDGRIGSAAPIIGGTAVSGTALVVLGGWTDPLTHTAAVIAVGVGHALIRAPQYAVAMSTTGGSATSLGLLRLVERIGALAGLWLGAIYLREYGFGPSLAVLGAVVLTGGAIFAILNARSFGGAAPPVAAR